MTGSVPSAIVDKIESHTGSSVKGFTFAGGGCINHGARVATPAGDFFLKWNDRATFPQMFAVEARGLAMLREANALAVPKVIYVGETGSYQFLLLEYVAEGKKSATYWEDFGSGLATLHRRSAPAFGLDHDNYIGSLAQSNSQHGSWVDFFIEERLKVQIQTARDSNRIDNGTTKRFEKLFANLPAMLPGEPPSLLHGDLWSGNLMTSPQGKPCIIDPAIYYGHREVDLAMTKLFGGFNWSYLSSYNEVFPLQPGYEERLDVYNLYPLLVHVNLFGGAYKSQVVEVLRRFA